MTKKQNIDDKKSKELSLEEMFKEQIYNINIKGSKIEDSSQTSINITMWANNLSQNLLYKFLLIFQTELDYFTKIISNDDLSSFIYDILTDDFHEEIKNNQNLEDCINNKIKQLEENKFLSSKGLDKRYEDLEDEYIKISIEDVKHIILVEAFY
ncbi:MAG: hypothetical protein P8Y97_23835 [Candidatus Lokiarchaeota archaeon]